MLEYSDHASKRARQRGLSREEILYVVNFGECYRRSGAMHYYLRYKDLPRWDCSKPHWTRLVGTVVVLGGDGRSVITVYRNRKAGPRFVKKKPRYGKGRDDETWAE